MKKFAGNKTLEQIRAQCKAQGLELDTRKYEIEGSDFVTVSGGGAHAIFNTCSGWFFGKTPDGTEFDSSSDKFDGTPWFDALLEFFYVSKPTP